MIQVPHLPGFRDSVHDAQVTFRVMLEALANPGSQRSIPVFLEAPQGMSPACAAACLTLFDLETQVWLEPTLSAAAQWLLFHTGCLLIDDPRAANFAIINDAQAMPSLSMFHQGTAEAPEDSTTLLVQINEFASGEQVILTGPGIQQTRQLTVKGLRSTFWTDLAANNTAYPLGVDVFLFSQDKVVGLPRTTINERI